MTTRKVCAFKTHLSHGHTTGHLNAKSYILSRWNWTTCGLWLATITQIVYF